MVAITAVIVCEVLSNVSEECVYMDKSKVCFISNDSRLPFPITVLFKFNDYDAAMLKTLIETVCIMYFPLNLS